MVFIHMHRNILDDQFNLAATSENAPSSVATDDRL